MPFTRDTLQTILNRVAEDIHTRMTEAGDALRRQVEELFAYALASESHSMRGQIQHAVKQSVPSLADDEEAILAWARTMLPVPRKPATRGTGTVLYTGTNGVVIPAGREMSLLLKSEVRFRTTAEVTVAGGVAILPVEAIALGSGGNAPLGGKTVLTVPIAGVVSTGTIMSPGITGGFALETLESVQERTIHRFRNPPRGGVPADFESWAREISGIDRAWGIDKIQGIGSIGVAVATKHSTLEQWDVPLAPKLAEVQAHIDSVAPAFMRARVVIAPTLVTQNFEIDISPNTPAVREAVEAEIRDLLLREASLGGQSAVRDNYDDPREPHVIPLSHIREAISTAAGENDHALVEPSADLVADAFELIVPGSFVFSDL